MLLPELRPHIADLLTPYPFFRECKPRILVYTDGLNYDPNDGFSLSLFVDALRSGSIHGMSPLVETAHLNNDPDADHPNFDFTPTTFNKSKYDVLFLFGAFSGTGLPASELDVIVDFMEGGGGVFATGDHSTLGEWLCSQIPRVRNMRFWGAGTPSASGTDRISTNHPGADNAFQFVDQSDAIPQHLYPAYSIPAGSTMNADSEPHYLLQHPTKKIIEVFPDHPHEGICYVPSDLTTTFTHNGNTLDEWPTDAGGVRVSPVLVAQSMSYGGGFDSKRPLQPKAFGAIVAYDGQACGKGRVSVDSTWHHFININLDGTDASIPSPGLQGDADVYDRVQTYFRNIAAWLMPKRRRWCLRYRLVLVATKLDLNREWLFDMDPSDTRQVIELGAEIRRSLSRVLTRAQMRELELDLIEDHDPELASGLKQQSELSIEDPFGVSECIASPVTLVANVAIGNAAVQLHRKLPLNGHFDSSLKEAGGLDRIVKQIHESAEGHLEATMKSYRAKTQLQQKQLKRMFR